MSLKDITITGSIGSIATQSYGQRTYISSTDEQSFPIEHITGSDAKAWPNFVQGENYTIGLVVNVTQSWPGSNVTPLGIVPYVHNTMEEFIDGEFSGSNYVVTDGNLNDVQCEQFLTVNTTPVEYVRDTTLYDDYYDEGVLVSSDFNTFTGVTPSSGEFVLYQKTSFDGVLTTTRSILWAKISKLDNFGNDNTISLQELKSFKWKDNTAGEITLTVLDIVEHSSYFLYQVYSKSWTTGALSNTTVNVVISPYLLSNFTNSDCDVLINNASQNDISGFYRRVLYDGDSGSLVPSNFQQIISGTAEYAQVNDYLFNASANVLPRYEGCRVEQQFLNKWTLGDISPSLTPSIQFLKTSVAYSETIKDQAPIKMNASKAVVKYYINETGNTVTPNVDKLSIYTAQGNFPSEENLIINFPLQGTTTPSQYKPIIRGGSRLEPILYNQIRDYTNPPMEWSSSIYFTDNNPSSSVTINDYSAILSPSYNFIILPSTSTNGAPSGVLFNQIVQQGIDITTELNATNKYTVTNNIITENLSLIFYTDLSIKNSTPGATVEVTACLMRTRGGNTDRWYGQEQTIQVPPGNYNTQLLLYDLVPVSELMVGDEFNIGMFWTFRYGVNPGDITLDTTSYFRVVTDPSPTPSINVTGLFFCLDYTTFPQYSNYIFTTSSDIINYYGDPFVCQKDISGSTFPPVTLPFTLQIGDEFRFEGDESKVFMVEKATLSSASVDITSSHIAIKLDKPITASNGGFANLDQFVLRRYVDDAESIIFNNTADKNITGKMILSPEYTTPQLQNNINTYIEDLTQKGLI